jgi:hypothetical protein
MASAAVGARNAAAKATAARRYAPLSHFQRGKTTPAPAWVAALAVKVQEIFVRPIARD